MEPRDFCYWLQGVIESRGIHGLTNEELTMVEDHLKLVFKKVTPERKFTREELEELGKFRSPPLSPGWNPPFVDPINPFFTPTCTKDERYC